MIFQSGGEELNDEIVCQQLQNKKIAQKLQIIKLKNCQNFFGINVFEQSHSLTNLLEISLLGSNIVQQGLDCLLQSPIVRNLKKLDLRYCKNFTGQDSFKQSKASNLTSMQLSHSSVTCGGLAQIVLNKNFQELIQLLVAGIEAFSEENLPSFVSQKGQLKNLKYLDLTESNIKDSDTLQLMNCCPELQIINLGGCQEFSGKDVFSKIRNSQLEAVYVNDTKAKGNYILDLFQSPSALSIHCIKYNMTKIPDQYRKKIDNCFAISQKCDKRVTRLVKIIQVYKLKMKRIRSQMIREIFEQCLGISTLLQDES